MYSWQKQLSPEEVKAKIEYEESLAVEERRKRYKCQRYYALDEVKPWTVDLEALQKIEQSPPIEPLYPANALINQKISHFTGNNAIVNAANESMLGGGGIDGAIHSAAGDDLYNECKTIPKGESGDRCDCGAAKITRGYRLPAKYIHSHLVVIHTVGPRGEKPELLRSAYNSVLQIVKEKKIRSVALCGISTGIFGYPLESASRIACETVRTWLEDESNRNEIDRIIFITFLEKEKTCYNRLLQEYFPYTPDLDFVEAWKKDPTLFMERKEKPAEVHVLPEEIKEGIVHVEQHPLKHAEIVHDASAPILPSVNKLLHEITEDHVLKHVEQVHDTSAPVIEPTVHVGQNQHGNLLNELTNTEHPLKHTEIVHDASAPVITANAHVGTNPLVAVLAEIKKPDDV